MASYRYTGRNQEGQESEGIYEAISASVVANRLLERGITPVSIVENIQRQSWSQQLEESLGLNRVSSADIIMFSRQMHTICRSGLPLVKALRSLASTAKNRSFQNTLNHIVEQLESGSSLANAMRQHPQVFNHLFVNMVYAGESSGRLEEIFLQLSTYLSKDLETSKRIKTALRYPSFVFIALLIAIGFVNVKVIPVFADMFKKFDTELPWMTRLLVASSEFFVAYWLYLLVLLVLAYIVTKKYIGTAQGSLHWGRWKLKFPLIGNIILLASMGRYGRGFALMMKSGVPVNQCLNLCADAMDNEYFKFKIRSIRQSVERGDSLLQAHSQAEIFPPLVLQMIAVGEESGQVEELLEQVSYFYEEEVDYELVGLSSKIEPLLVVVMAAFVLILALGIFEPMWSMFSIQK